MSLPKRFAGNPESYKEYLRRLKNFKNWSEEKLDEYVRAKAEDRSPELALDALRYKDIEERLPDHARSEFRRRVAVYLKELGKTASSKAFEHRVKLFVLAEMKYEEMVSDDQLKPGDFHKATMAINNFAESIGITNRRSSVKEPPSDDFLFQSLAKSSEKAKMVVVSRAAWDKREQELFGEE